MSGVGAGPLPDGDPRALLEALLLRFAQASDPREPATALLSVAAPRFASRAGDAEHLAHLFGNAAWAPLLGHAAAETGEVEVLDDAARATVRVRAADGTTVSYLASLRRGVPAGPPGDGSAPDGSATDGSAADGSVADGSAAVWRVTGLVRSELADA